MLHQNRDMIMCILWMLTYTLVLIGIEKYKYPIIPLSSQLFLASLEFSVAIELIVIGSVGWNYIWIAYIYWTIVEIAIIVSQIRLGFILKKHIVWYIMFLAILTALMCYCVICKRQRLFLTHFNTLVGEIIWLFHIRKTNYPRNPLVISIFIIKFLADTIDTIVYFRSGSWIVSLMCAVLPVIDFAFIHIYFMHLEDTGIDDSTKTTFI